MAAPDAFTLPASGSSRRAARADGLAYVALERARLTCEQLLERVKSPVLVDALRLARGELGKAAYLASEHLPADLREHLYASVRWGSREPAPPAENTTEHALMLGVRGAEVTAGLRGDPELGEAMPSAYFHALEGVSALAALAGSPRAQHLCRKAVGLGQLDPAWLPAVLSSIAAVRSAAGRKALAG